MSEKEINTQPSQEQENDDNKPIPVNTSTQIAYKVATLKEKYGERFDEKAFIDAAQSYADVNGSILNIDEKEFVKKDEKKEDKDKDKDKEEDEDEKGCCGKCKGCCGRGFNISNEDGKFIARAADGTIIEGKDFADMNRQVCQDLKQHAINNGKEPSVSYNPGSDISGSEKRIQCEIFAKEAIEQGIVVAGGWPEDKQFWQNFKKEYMQNPEHSKEEWDRLTRKIPSLYLGRDKEELESSRNELKIDEGEPRSKSDFLKELRSGRNPNVPETMPKEKTVATPQSNTRTTPVGKGRS